MNRIWIIGNGPSLKHTPLHLLKDEATFATNRIFLLYPHTDWRPTYYFKLDISPYHAWFWKDEILANIGTPMYLWSMFKDGYPEGHPNRENMPDGGVGDIDAVWLDRCERHHYYSAGNSKAPSSWHLPELCSWGTGISTMMQIAVLMGYDEIYLLGCDGYFIDDYKLNYFTPDYICDSKRDAKRDNYYLGEMHRIASHSSPIPIYNASMRSSYDAHKRVHMLDVLETPRGDILPMWRPNDDLHAV